MRKPAPIFRDTAALMAAVSDDAWWMQVNCVSRRLVMTSGFLDPSHRGHSDCIREAHSLGNRLLFVVNGDRAAVAKKGYSFMDEESRAQLVSDNRFVDFVLIWQESTVEQVIRAVKPDVFAKGGDRSDLERMDPGEVRACFDVKCRIVTGVGGAHKVESSSALIRRAAALLPPA